MYGPILLSVYLPKSLDIVLNMVKQFGTGVIISTAFVHVSLSHRAWFTLSEPEAYLVPIPLTHTLSTMLTGNFWGSYLRMRALCSGTGALGGCHTKLLLQRFSWLAYSYLSLWNISATVWQSGIWPDPVRRKRTTKVWLASWSLKRGSSSIRSVSRLPWSLRYCPTPECHM